MDQSFYLDVFERYHKRGLAAHRAGDLRTARTCLLKAAEIETGLVTARNSTGKPVLHTPVDLPLEVTVKFFETSKNGVFRFPSLLKDDRGKNLIHYNSSTIKAQPGQTDLKSLLDSLTR